MARYISANPFFGVSSAPVFVNDKEVPGRMALVNEENGSVLGILSDTKYKPVSNMAVNSVFSEAFDNLPVLKTTDHLSKDFSAWKRRVVLDKSAFDMQIVGDDSMGLMIEIFNSYNGKTSWGYSLLGYRWMCENGMVFGKKTLFSQTFGHMQDAITKIQNIFSSQVKGVENILETWRGWTKIDFPAEAMEIYMKINEVPERVATRVIEVYEERNRTENLKATKYAAFNALTYLGTHNEKTRGGTDPVFSNTNKRFMDLADGLYSYNSQLVLTA